MAERVRKGGVSKERMERHQEMLSRRARRHDRRQKGLEFEDPPNVEEFGSEEDVTDMLNAEAEREERYE